MRADARANRTALIEAARRLYTTKGPDVPFGAIAEEAGVGVGTLYRHFPGQLDLVVGLAETLREEIHEITGRWRGPMSTDPEDAWPRFVADIVDMRVAAYMPRVVEGIVTDEVVPRVASIRRDALTDLESILDLARSAGLVEPSVTAEQFQIGLAVVTRPLPEATTALLPDVTEWLVDVYLAGLRPSAEPEAPPSR